LWQVSGKNRTTFDRMIQLDIQYAKDRTIGMDLKIILLTVPAVLSQVRDMCRVRWARNEGQTFEDSNNAPCKQVDIDKDAPRVRV
jgi:hypothetical protein